MSSDVAATDDEYDQGFVGDECDDGPELFWWSVRRLWRLAATQPVRDVPIDELAAVLEQALHETLTKRDLAEVAKRIWDADLSYPIIFAAKGWLMDGSHRIMKTYALGLPTVRVVRFAEEPKPDYRATPEEMSDILYRLRRPKTEMKNS